MLVEVVVGKSLDHLEFVLTPAWELEWPTICISIRLFGIFGISIPAVSDVVFRNKTTCVAFENKRTRSPAVWKFNSISDTSLNEISPSTHAVIII